MKNESWGLALKIMANISGWIAGPVIIGLYLGKWLDQKFGTDPWLFLITLGVCFFISMFGLVRTALQEFKQIDRDYAAAKKSPSITDETRDPKQPPK
jgi:F0F1-type ATP synthase assembly protein I